MGHKIPARANRLGVRIKRGKDVEPRFAADYDCSWFAEFSEFPDTLRQDWQIRQAIINKMGRKAGISKVKIDRKDERTEVNVHSIRPANILGKDNQRVDQLKREIEGFTNDNVRINVIEASVNDPQIIAEKIAYDLERRIAFRRATKTAISKAMASPDVIGIKIIISGRLGGAEIARTEWYMEGKVPLHTWWANIDNGFAEAETTYGIIGVKVILNKSLNANDSNNNRNSKSSHSSKAA